MKIFAEIRQGLQARTGISALFLQDDALKLAVRKRSEILATIDEPAYGEYLNQSEAEWVELIDEIVVSETWFLRDEKPFGFLAAHAKKQWFGHPIRPRILSAPCATGEEPYSIAIKLLETGLRPEGFEIDALDISERALETARKRTYRASAFRGNGLERSQYFEALPQGAYRLAKEFEQIVQFKRANLLDSTTFTEGSQYHVIFCRNLLIYLDDSARAQLLRILEKLLSPGGLLFVGHADAGAFTGSNLHPCGPSNAFVFEKGETARKSAVPQQSESSKTFFKSQLAENRNVFPPSRNSGKAVTEPPKQTSDQTKLKQATELADAGNLSAAGIICDEYLKAHKLCPKGMHLRAVLHLANGDRVQAERLFNQVTYLDPRHIEALLHLERLAELRGDRQSASIWRRRIENNQTLTRP